MNQFNDTGLNTAVPNEKVYTNDEAQLVAPVLDEADEIIEMGEDFDFDGFQVVRREFFAHMREPSCSFNNCKFYVNAACLSRFPSYDYAQVLINRERKILALRPCHEGARDSFQWCTVSKGKRKSRQITCKLFFAKIFSLMDWDPNHRYKLLGNVIHANDEYLLAFDLTATEVYQRTTPEGEKPRASRIPVFPAEWQNQFGLSYAEHKQSMQINIVDGYAVYSIKGAAEENQNVDTNAGVSGQTALSTIVQSQFGGGSI